MDKPGLEENWTNPSCICGLGKLMAPRYSKDLPKRFAWKTVEWRTRDQKLQRVRVGGERAPSSAAKAKIYGQEER